ncbi:hydroxymethylglutaryl-CoA reductase, degradative [Carnobacteriaceae bacterium zg-ZUI78]|uniref:hydroxymethylglutaryl-CoA reductase, degradative n=1 Tax=Granulicatella sp. zg-84 TaxID=2678503 RepID=UPI0013C0D688|nr:hydroxymethylglutaryl-CoA reductase, degradative [Granulicatella sp. zg-84]MBS4750282.1 hydroxymethylglutaryl-CoA reductase, degradative [Carnobacteriaceae bacterium zg-ZUI78]NEW66579.1 hydroxymethylglutaryl-CoA reductase, degradative [Granulicatella sp. zg-84]QMI85780.1 hydroxymethylglutaryl-CoA reductase, degradative [Carnobacteriaceae bacterium zg-84]
MTQFKQFYKKTQRQRQEILASLPTLTEQDKQLLFQNNSLSSDIANTITENNIGLYAIPLGVAPDIVIDGKTYLAPMATEEPSVIAAASFGAQIIKKAGGFHILKNDRYMIGEIALCQLDDIEHAKMNIEAQKDTLLSLANQSYPSIVKRGGGAKNLFIDIKTSQDKTHTFLIIYLMVDTKEAMGANILNTMLEAIKPTIETLANQSAIMSILSNYANHSLTSISCQIPVSLLTTLNTNLTGEQVRDKIIQAYQLATADIYRATTHNKGIMNGISAVVLATGNDTRAIEAGAHAFATHTGTYQPLTVWEKADNGDLKGTITIPLPIGYVGGSINIHPSAVLSQHISQTTNAKELATLIASVGLAQNLAALRALVSEGIQHGHMALQLKSLALSVGATQDEIPLLVEKLKQEKVVNQEIAKKLLQTLK